MPTSSDNVFFDANSFSASKKTVTLNTSAKACLNMDFTGATDNPIVSGNGALFLYGTLTTIAGMTWTHYGFLYLQKSGSNTFTSNGVTFQTPIFFGNGGGSWTLGDALTITSTLYHNGGTFDTGNFALNCRGINSYGSTVRTINLGSSTVTVPAGDWSLAGTNLTFNAGTSTILFSTGGSIGNIFYGGGYTYNNVTIASTNTIAGSNTFSTLTLTAGKTVTFTASTTQTVSSFVATGSAGNIITLRSSTAGLPFSISDTTGTNTCDFLDIKDCVVSGGATFLAGDSSVDSGNNTGWTNPWTNPANVYSSNNVYATHTATDGDLYVQLSKDGGATWQTALLKTFTGVEGEQTYGSGATELWGTSWTGADMTNANFKLRIIAQASNSFNTQVYGNFDFDGEINADRIVEGIEVKIEAKWDGTTTSVDALSVRVYSSGSSVPVVEGSFAYDNQVGVPMFFNGASNWKRLISEDDTATTAIAGIVELATDAETLTGANTACPITPSNLEYARAQSGWIPSGETWTYGSADGPTFTETVSGDKTTKYSPGMRFRCTQDQALTALWHMENNSNDATANAHNGTDTSITYNAGNAKFGSYGAGFASASSSKIVVTDHANLKPTGNFTIGAWVKTSTTGAIRTIFASYAQNTNVAGIRLDIEASNTVSCISGKNTGTTGGTDYQTASGSTNVCDNAWHMVVTTWNGSFLNIYIDGVLEGRTYWANAPVYQATNYVRIGCRNLTGTDAQFYDGALDDVFLINGYALGEHNIKALYDRNTALATTETLTKYFMVSKAPSYSAPNSTITLYGGTDNVLANATISSPYYSSVKAPFGFPLNPTKWTVEVTDNTDRSQASPVSGTWYNLGTTNSQITIPIGSWNVCYEVVSGVGYTPGGAGAFGVIMEVTLSTTNNSETDTTMTSANGMEANGAAGVRENKISTCTKSKILVLTTKTLYYLLGRASDTSPSDIAFVNSRGDLRIRAVSAYL